MSVIEPNTIMIMGTVACSAFGVGYVVSEKIGKVGRDFTKALTETKEVINEKFGDHALRMQRLELNIFGETHSGKNPDKMDLKV